MKKMIKLCSQLLATACLSLVLVACDRITQDNFNKVRPNMSLQEVTAILGNPTSSQSIDIGGISGTAAVWKSKDTEITIQFLNNKVLLKNFSKDGSTPMPELGAENGANGN